MKIIILIILIILGTIGYLEKILKFQIPRVLTIAFLILFVVVSAIQLFISHNSATEVSLMKTEIERSHKEMVSVKTELEESKNKLSEIKYKIAPRKLTSQQRDKIVAELKTIPSALPIWFRVIVGDAEAEDYSKEFCALFSESGHAIPKERVLNQMITPKPRGLLFYISSEKDPAAQVAARLQYAFKMAGLNLQGLTHPEEPPGRIRIVVGEKP